MLDVVTLLLDSIHCSVEVRSFRKCSRYSLNHNRKTSQNLYSVYLPLGRGQGAAEGAHHHGRMAHEFLRGKSKRP